MKMQKKSQKSCLYLKKSIYICIINIKSNAHIDLINETMLNKFAVYCDTSNRIFLNVT
ncbi:MAG: hypothetical protein RL757_917 [Bacteroidota bacterium]|jgi:hypothetical protein